MTNIDWFNFEKKDLDFPFYKKNPYIPKQGWIVLFIALIFGFMLSGSSKIGLCIFSCVILIVPVVYYLQGDYHAIFQKPSLKEIGLAVALFVGYMIYADAMNALLEFFGVVSNEVIPLSSIDYMLAISSIFSLMAEEFLKFIPFIFFMRIIYKYTSNRKMAVIISMLLVMIFFASIHVHSFQMLIYALFIQGFGSIFEFYGYIKTKNIWISYITHLCTDMFIFALVLSGLNI